MADPRVALDEVLGGVRGVPVLVVGDALLDEYLVGSGARIAREAPVPQIGVDRRYAVPGGAGNVAANLAALGADVRFLSVVGDDPDGAALLAALARAGVPTGDVLVEAGRATVAKRRLLAGDQLVLRFDEGGPEPTTAATAAEAGRRLPGLLVEAEAVVVSDYGYGLLGTELVDRLAAALGAGVPGRRTVVVDARDVVRYRALAPTAVTPSYQEALGLLGPGTPATAGRADRVLASAGRLHEATGARIVVVTLDTDGSLVCEQDRPAYRTWARPAPHRRACGAGDSFAAAFALALGAGLGTAAAAELAQAAATVVTGKDGTSTCSLDDLRAHLTSTTTGLVGPAELAGQVDLHRSHGRRIVFTNGCFDLLHQGHVDLLTRAKALGDVLVVGLNSDASISRLHGRGRPVVPLADRARVLGALSAVDHLVAFDDATAAALVDRLRPDVYVKGGDYVRAMLPEAPHVERYGGRVQILPYSEDRTTVELIERIRGVGTG